RFLMADATFKEERSSARVLCGKKPWSVPNAVLIVGLLIRAGSISSDRNFFGREYSLHISEYWIGNFPSLKPDY
ncbi:MAG: hypothetical protein ABI865_15390, partial [Nitrosospira sp.]